MLIRSTALYVFHIAKPLITELKPNVYCIAVQIRWMSKQLCQVIKQSNSLVTSVQVQHESDVRSADRTTKTKIPFLHFRVSHFQRPVSLYYAACLKNFTNLILNNFN